MAAVFMRKYAIRHWDKLAGETRTMLQQNLLERLRLEPEYAVCWRHILPFSLILLLDGSSVIRSAAL